jgi:hypothetical protein
MSKSDNCVVVREITKYMRFRKFGGESNILVPYSLTGYAISVHVCFIPKNRRVDTKKLLCSMYIFSPNTGPVMLLK